MALARLLAVLALTAVAACSAQRPAAEAPAAAAVVLGNEAPPPGYVAIGPVSAQSGKGCGVWGESGNREDAERKLRAEAARIQASYVRITSYQAPLPNHQCLEHEHKLSGTAYRAATASRAAAASAPLERPAARAAPAAAAAPPTFPVVLQDFEGNASLGRPAPTTATSSLTLALARGETSGSALSVTYTCSGDDQRANLDVWTEARVTDWRAAAAVRLRIKPDAALSVSVSFIDGNHTGYTQESAPLIANEWQTITLPLYKFWHNPFRPPGDHPGAPADLSHVSAFGFAPRGCQSGHFLLDDVTLTNEQPP